MTTVQPTEAELAVKDSIISQAIEIREDYAARLRRTLSEFLADPNMARTLLESTMDDYRDAYDVVEASKVLCDLCAHEECEHEDMGLIEKCHQCVKELGNVLAQYHEYQAEYHYE